jgi:hypothetical protein
MGGYSPVLGALTALFEIVAGIWAVFGARRPRILRPVAALLFLLAAYQVLEVVICAGGNEQKLFLSRLAFVTVTWLPPVTLLLISRAYGAASRALRVYVRGVFALAGIMTLWIVMDYRFITGTICHFMYSSYAYLEPWFHIYGAFYEITQLSTVFIAILCLASAEDRRARLDLADILVGILLYLLPALLVAAIVRTITDRALPSIMCHFALFYAIFLVRIARRERRQAGAVSPSGRG